MTSAVRKITNSNPKYCLAQQSLFQLCKNYSANCPSTIVNYFNLQVGRNFLRRSEIRMRSSYQQFKQKKIAIMEMEINWNFLYFALETIFFFICIAKVWLLNAERRGEKQILQLIASWEDLLTKGKAQHQVEEKFHLYWKHFLSFSLHLMMEAASEMSVKKLIMSFYFSFSLNWTRNCFKRNKILKFPSELHWDCFAF